MACRRRQLGPPPMLHQYPARATIRPLEEYAHYVAVRTEFHKEQAARVAAAKLLAEAMAGSSASAEASAASGLSAPTEVQAAIGDPPRDDHEQAYLASKSSFSAVSGQGMYVMAEQDMNRVVPWSDLLPQRGGDRDEEGASSVYTSSSIESEDEDGPIGPSLKDHPFLSEPWTEEQLCTTCFYRVLQDR